jgi:iron only hydrogenase large subunit-like protein
VDIVLSTRELGVMIKEAGILFRDLPDSEFDNPLGRSTGAGIIFGATGGVCEAALRTAADWLEGKHIKQIDFEDIRGLKGIKEAKVKIAGKEVKIVVSSGLGNARKILEGIRRGEAKYDIIEIMACPGGCLNGGGQPYIHGDTDILEKRRQAIYQEDKGKPIRKSHQNPDVKKLYAEYLGEPGSEKAHHLLHTEYFKRHNY